MTVLHQLRATQFLGATGECSEDHCDTESMRKVAVALLIAELCRKAHGTAFHRALLRSHQEIVSEFHRGTPPCLLQGGLAEKAHMHVLLARAHRLVAEKHNSVVLASIANSRPQCPEEQPCTPLV